MIRGMIRLSNDSALGFSLMINNNDVNTALFKEIMSYILKFEKPTPDGVSASNSQ
jgi:hypothetical protein